MALQLVPYLRLNGIKMLYCIIKESISRPIGLVIQLPVPPLLHDDLLQSRAINRVLMTA